jgi:hypothetical protein
MLGIQCHIPEECLLLNSTALRNFMYYKRQEISRVAKQQMIVLQAVVHEILILHLLYLYSINLIMLSTSLVVQHRIIGW